MISPRVRRKHLERTKKAITLAKVQLFPCFRTIRHHPDMNLRWKTLALLCLLELTLLVVAHGDHAHTGGDHNLESKLPDEEEPVYYSNVTVHSSGGGHSHSHMHAGAPKTVLNEVRTRTKSTLSCFFVDWLFLASRVDSPVSHATF